MSPKCQYCTKLIENIQQRNVPNVEIVNIHFQRPYNVTNVPTMIGNNKMYVGKQCLELIEDMSNLNMDGFEFQTGNEFSYIDSEEAYSFKSEPFSFIDNSQIQPNPQAKGDAMMDMLIQKRNSEVPQPIKRV